MSAAPQSAALRHSGSRSNIRPLETTVPHSAALSNESQNGGTNRGLGGSREHVGKCGTVRRCGTVTVATLHALADRVVRLCPDRRDPEAFWEAKSEVAHALRELASKLGRAP